MNAKKTFLTAGLALFTTLALAQTYSIDWSTIDGGGGTSTGGVYSVSGSLGQPDAGTMSGGNYTLDGGFWGIIATVQPPGAPRLTITLMANKALLLSWPSPSTGFLLQQNSTLAETGWANVTQSQTDNGATISTTINAPIGNLFFRLKK
jgi:hypothetical protein